MRSAAFLSFVVATAFTSASWFTFLAAAPYLLAERLHEPPSTYGLMILLPIVAVTSRLEGVVDAPRTPPTEPSARVERWIGSASCQGDGCPSFSGSPEIARPITLLRQLETVRG
jgi:hypothetical protein